MFPKFPRVCVTVLRFSLTVLHSFLTGSAPSICFMSEPRNDYGSNAKWSARYYENVTRYQRARTPAPARDPKLPFKYTCVEKPRCHSSTLRIALPC